MLACRIVKLELFLGEIFTIYKGGAGKHGSQGKSEDGSLEERERGPGVHQWPVTAIPFMLPQNSFLHGKLGIA